MTQKPTHEATTISPNVEGESNFEMLDTGYQNLRGAEKSYIGAMQGMLLAAREAKHTYLPEMAVKNTADKDAVIEAVGSMWWNPTPYQNLRKGVDPNAMGKVRKETAVLQQSISAFGKQTEVDFSGAQGKLQNSSKQAVQFVGKAATL